MDNVISRKEAISKGLKEYFTGKPCKNGHIAARSLPSCNCKQCSKEYSYSYVRSDSYKEYDRNRNKTPERVAYLKDYNYSDARKEVAKRYSTSSKGKETLRKYRQTEKSKETQSKYHRSEKYKSADRERNKTQKRKDKSREYGRRETTLARLREKYSTDILFKLRTAIRVSLRRCLKGKRSPSSTINILGCSLDFLREYLEGQFRDGMTWENYGSHWHLDHIKPISSFSDLTDEDQLREVQHYTNLQPLLVHENLSKHSKQDFCLERYKMENAELYK